MNDNQINYVILTYPDDEEYLIKITDIDELNQKASFTGELIWSRYGTHHKDYGKIMHHMYSYYKFKLMNRNETINNYLHKIM